MENWLSGRAAAKRLGVSHVTIARWVREGRISPLGQVGKQVVFDSEYIDKLAAKREGECIGTGRGRRSQDNANGD